MKLSEEQVAMVGQRVSLPGARQVVLVDVGGRKDVSVAEYNSNIYCLDDENNIVWQVSSPNPRMGRDSFVDIGFENGVLRANRFFGGEYVIDVSTGVAEESGWHK